MSSIIRSKSSYFSAYTVMLRDRYEIEKYRRAMTVKWVQNMPKDALPVEDVENFDKYYKEECRKKKTLSRPSKNVKALPKKRSMPIKTVEEILSSNLNKLGQCAKCKIADREIKKIVEKSRSKKIKNPSQSAKQKVSEVKLNKPMKKIPSKKISKPNESVKLKIPEQKEENGVDKRHSNKTYKTIQSAKLKAPALEIEKILEQLLSNKTNKLSQSAKHKVSNKKLEERANKIKSSVNNEPPQIDKRIIAKQHIFEKLKRIYSTKTNKPPQSSRFHITEKELEEVVEKFFSNKENKPIQSTKSKLTEDRLEEAVVKILSNMQNKQSKFAKCNVAGKNVKEVVRKISSIVKSQSTQSAYRKVTPQRRHKKVPNKEQIQLMNKLRAYEKSVLSEALQTLLESVPLASTLQSKKYDASNHNYCETSSSKLESSQLNGLSIDLKTINALLRQERLHSKSKNKSSISERSLKGQSSVKNISEDMNILENRNFDLSGYPDPYQKSYRNYDLLTKPSSSQKSSEVDTVRLNKKYINSNKELTEEKDQPYINCDKSDKLLEALGYLKNMNSRHVSKKAEAIRKTYSLTKNMINNPLTRKINNKLSTSKVNPFMGSLRKEKNSLPPLCPDKSLSYIRKIGNSSSCRGEVDQRFYNMGAAYMKALLSGRAAQQSFQPAQRTRTTKKTGAGKSERIITSIN